MSPRKIRALRAFTNWMRALEGNPHVRLNSFATAQGLRPQTVWRYVHAEPKIAQTLIESVTQGVQEGLAMAVQRGVEALAGEGEEGVDNQDALKWAEFFAKYAHGGFRQKGDQSGVKIEVNVGVPAHVRARLGIEDENEVKEIDATLKDELGGLVAE